MATVDSGTVEFSRVRKDDDYGINRSAKATLSFTLAENEAVEPVLAAAFQIAQNQVHVAIGLVTPAVPVAAPKSDVPKTDVAALVASEPKKKVGRPPKAAAAAPAPAADALEEPTEAPAAPPAADALDDLLGPQEEAEEPVTDADLNSAVQKKNEAVKNPGAIRKLIQSFNPEPGKGGFTLASIPAGERRAFLAKLAQVPALA